MPARHLPEAQMALAMGAADLASVRATIIPISAVLKKERSGDEEVQAGGNTVNANTANCADGWCGFGPHETY